MVVVVITVLDAVEATKFSPPCEGGDEGVVAIPRNALGCGLESTVVIFLGTEGAGNPPSEGGAKGGVSNPRWGGVGVGEVAETGWLSPLFKEGLGEVIGGGRGLATDNDGIVGAVGTEASVIGAGIVLGAEAGLAVRVLLFSVRSDGLTAVFKTCTPFAKAPDTLCAA